MANLKHPSMPEVRVVVVDDDVVTRFLIGTALRDEHGIDTFECESAEALFVLLEKQRVDVIILDMVLPQINGLDALTYLREQSDVGIIMISSRANAQHRLIGLRDGADDFINKPVITDELVFKVKSLAARVHNQRGTIAQQNLIIGNCELIVDENTITSADQERCCALTEAEQRILVALVQHATQVCSRKLLHQCVSRSEITINNDRSIDTLISRIRNKLKKLGCTASITSVRGQGYRLQVDESSFENACNP